MIVQNQTNKALVFDMKDGYRLKINPNTVTEIESKYVSELKANKYFKMFREQGSLNITKDEPEKTTNPVATVAKK